MATTPKRRAPSSPPKGKRPKKRSPKKSLPAQLKRLGIGISVLVLTVILAGYLLDRFLAGSSEKLLPLEKVHTAKTSPLKFEIYPKETPKPVEAPKPEKVIPKTEEPTVLPESPRKTKKLPLVAIIIDDMGYDRQLAKKLLDLNSSLTFSVLPFSPYREEIMRAAEKKGVEIMLHLPMEPEEYPQVDPGAGALLTPMSPDELAGQLLQDIRSVPGATGVNNHMGSKMTAVSSQMYQIFTILKKEGLFFIDSKTSASSLCRPSARLLQVPFAERDVFLDHVETAVLIRKQLRELMLKAEQKGEAIGIGHPHQITYQVLKEMLPELKKRVRLVPASQLVRQIG